MTGTHRAEPETSNARTAVAGALTAAALLLAPIGVALATPGLANAAPTGGGPGNPGGPGAPGGGTGSTPPGGGNGGPGGIGGGNNSGGAVLGVGNRPALPRPAPLVTVGQTFGDSIFDHQPLLNGSPIGGIYHVMLGASGTPDNGDGIHQPGEAYQGAYTGVLNMTPPAGSTTTSPNAAPRFPNRSPAPNRNPAADIPEVQWRPTP